MRPLDGLSTLALNPLAGLAPSVAPYSNTKSMLFDGVDEYVNCGNGADVKMGTGDFSGFCFVKRGVVGVKHAVLSYGSASDPKWYIRLEANNKLRFDVDDGTTQTVLASPGSMRISDLNWHSVGFSFDRSSATGLIFYKDGVTTDPGQDASASNLTLNHVTNGFMIGARFGGADPFNGNIDEASLWDRVLTPSEFAELHNGGVALNLVNHSAYADLLTWWRMGDKGIWTPGTSSWAIPDQKGSSDGTSVNMQEADVVTDVPS